MKKANRTVVALVITAGLGSLALVPALQGHIATSWNRAVGAGTSWSHEDLSRSGLAFTTGPAADSAESIRTDVYSEYSTEGLIEKARDNAHLLQTGRNAGNNGQGGEAGWSDIEIQEAAAGSSRDRELNPEPARGANQQAYTNRESAADWARPQSYRHYTPSGVGEPNRPTGSGPGSAPPVQTQNIAPPVEVPEPATLGLMALGMAAIGLRRRKAA